MHRRFPRGRTPCKLRRDQPGRHKLPAVVLSHHNWKEYLAHCRAATGQPHVVYDARAVIEQFRRQRGACAVTAMAFTKLTDSAVDLLGDDDLRLVWWRLAVARLRLAGPRLLLRRDAADLAAAIYGGVHAAARRSPALRDLPLTFNVSESSLSVTCLLGTTPGANGCGEATVARLTMDGDRLRANQWEPTISLVDPGRDFAAEACELLCRDVIRGLHTQMRRPRFLTESP